MAKIFSPFCFLRCSWNERINRWNVGLEKRRSLVLPFRGVGTSRCMFGSKFRFHGNDWFLGPLYLFVARKVVFLSVLVTICVGYSLFASSPKGIQREKIWEISALRRKSKFVYLPFFLEENLFICRYKDLVGRSTIQSRFTTIQKNMTIYL